MIVNYGDFYFTKDDGYLAFAYAPDPDGKGLEHICYVEPGTSLAELVAKAWQHRGAPAAVVEQATGVQDGRVLRVVAENT
jgi:hypothetical protein